MQTKTEQPAQTGKEQSIRTYIHTVQYYETDGMRIVHHSNYIRWMEEARSDYLKQVGLDYDKMEEHGIMIPVLAVSCKYKVSVSFGQQVKIFVWVEKFNGIKFTVSYRITSMDETVLHAEGTTEHCFLNTDLKPVNVKKAAPPVYAHFSQFRKTKA